jgi:hypothetical protein
MTSKRNIDDRLNELESTDEEDDEEEPLMVIEHDDGTRTTYL